MAPTCQTQTTRAKKTHLPGRVYLGLGTRREPLHWLAKGRVRFGTGQHISCYPEAIAQVPVLLAPEHLTWTMTR